MIFGRTTSDKKNTIYNILYSMKHDGFKKFAWLPAHLENGQWIWLEPYWAFFMFTNIEYIIDNNLCLWVWFIRLNYLTHNYTMSDAIVVKLKK